jgi:hypothetical protein
VELQKEASIADAESTERYVKGQHHLNVYCKELAGEY